MAEISIINFTYVKTPGNITDRKGIVISRPDHNWLVVEITDNDLTPTQKLLDYLSERDDLDKKLQEKYGIKTAGLKFKKFSDEKILNIFESKINV